MYMQSVLTLFLSLLLAVVPLVQRVQAAADPVDHGQYATDLSKEMYCSVMNMISGDVGVLVGLGLSAYGFITLLLSGVGLAPVLFIAGGLLLTAIPGFFQAFLGGVAQVFSGLSGQDPSGKLKC